VARTTGPTFSSVPFVTTNFNQGPVGPALDTTTYTTSFTGKAYFGNWTSNGDVIVVSQSCPTCSFTASTVPVTITPAGDRITAIAFAARSATAPVRHAMLYIGHGTKLSIYDLDVPGQLDLDLAAATPPPLISSILSIAVHPVYGDIFVEVGDTALSRRILAVREDDHSVRNVRDLAVDSKVVPLPPATFSNDGRLVIAPSLQLLRYVPVLNAPPTFAQYGVTK